MKKIDFKKVNLDFLKNRTFRLIILIIIVILAIFLFDRGLEGKSSNLFDNSKNEEVVDIANSEDYSKYENSVKANFEGEHVLDFSFLYKNDLIVAQGTGAQVRWFKLLNATGTNDVTLYFTYEGGRGYSAEDYVKEVLKTNEDIKASEVKFANDENASTTILYVLDESNNTEYYVESVKGADGDSWLAIVENKKANDEVLKAAAKDLMRSLEIK